MNESIFSSIQAYLPKTQSVACLRFNQIMQVVQEWIPVLKLSLFNLNKKSPKCSATPLMVTPIWKWMFTNWDYLNPILQMTQLQKRSRFCVRSYWMAPYFKYLHKQRISTYLRSELKNRHTQKSANGKKSTILIQSSWNLVKMMPQETIIFTKFHDNQTTMEDFFTNDQFLCMSVFLTQNLVTSSLTIWLEDTL